MRVCIAGSRTFQSQEFMDERLAFYFQRGLPDLVVSGCANGADLLGECWADMNNVPVLRFPADWENLGKRAGFVRNLEMFKFATHGVFFWDGSSKGTRHTIELFEQSDKPFRVVLF